MILHMNVFESALFPVTHIWHMWPDYALRSWPPECPCGVLYTFLSHIDLLFAFAFPFTSSFDFVSFNSFLSSSFGTLSSIWFLWRCCCPWPGTTFSLRRGRIPGKMWWVAVAASRYPCAFLSFHCKIPFPHTNAGLNSATAVSSGRWFYYLNRTMMRFWML